MQAADMSLLQTMQMAVSQAMEEEPSAGLRPLLADLALGMRVLTARHAYDPYADTIASEQQKLQSLPQSPAPPAVALPSADDDVFVEYLRTKLGERDLRVDHVEQLSGGFSRSTIDVSVRAGSVSRSIILRKEIRGGLLEGIGARVTEEYPLLMLASAQGLPIPAPLWLETDPGIIGGAFVAMDRVAGKCLGTSTGATQSIPHDVLKNLAAMLAKLHGLNWRQASPALPAGLGFSTREAAAQDTLDGILSRWERYRRVAAPSPSPIVDTALEWLQRWMPSPVSSPCVTHGDVGFHNIMGEAGIFTGLLDWEMACLASPAKDLAHVRPSVEPFVDWTLFLDWYREAGGVPLPTSEIKWFEVFRAFSMTLVCQVAIAKLANVETARLEYLKLGYLAQPVFAAQLLTLIERQND